MGQKTVGPLTPTLTNGWYSLDLTPAKNFINKLDSSEGLTQIRIRFKLDDNDDKLANYLNLFSGNGVFGNRPILVVDYDMP